MKSIRTNCDKNVIIYNCIVRKNDFFVIFPFLYYFTLSRALIFIFKDLSCFGTCSSATPKPPACPQHNDHKFIRRHIISNRIYFALFTHTVPPVHSFNIQIIASMTAIMLVSFSLNVASLICPGQPVQLPFDTLIIVDDKSIVCLSVNYPSSRIIVVIHLPSVFEAI